MEGSSLDLPRCSGVLLHVTSLPGRGIGDLGPAAYRWIDWLTGAGQTLWQILPLVPINDGGSPYNGLSALAGNALLVSPERRVEEGLLSERDLGGEHLPSDRVDFPGVIVWKERLLQKAFVAFLSGAASGLREAFADFRGSPRRWTCCANGSGFRGCACCSSLLTAMRRMCIFRSTTRGTRWRIPARTTTRRSGSGGRRPTPRPASRYRLAPPRAEPGHRDLIGLVFASPAQWSIVPLQDVLGWSAEARMKPPGTVTGNWTWRLPAGLLTEATQQALAELTRATGRLALPASTTALTDR